MFAKRQKVSDHLYVYLQELKCDFCGKNWKHVGYKWL